MLKRKDKECIITMDNTNSKSIKNINDSKTKNTKIVNNFIYYGGKIMSHAEKHDERPDISDDWIAKDDYSYWKNVKKSRYLLKATLITYKKDLIGFLMDHSVNVITLKVRCKHTVGYLCKKGDNVFYKVNWICIVIQKTSNNSLFTKTYYPCANPNIR